MKTIIRLIILMMLFAIVAHSQETSPPLSEGKPSQHQSNASNKSDINSQTAKKITNPLPLPVIDKVNSAPENSCSNTGSKKNTCLNAWCKDDPMTRYTFWLMIFTGVLAVSTIGLWVVTKTSSDQVRKSVDLANKELILTQRPKLRVSAVIAKDISGRGEGPFVRGQLVHGQFYIRNIGGTPATITDIGCWIERFGNDTYLPMKRPYEGKAGNISDKPTLSPGEPHTVTFTSEEPLDVTGPAIMQKQVFLYVMGWIEYVDDLKIKRRIDFCRQYSVASHRFVAVTDPDYESKDQ